MASKRSKKYDLVFIIPHMGPGGAQRVVSNLLNYWAKNGKLILLITLNNNKPTVYTLNKGIDVITIGNDLVNNANRFNLINRNGKYLKNLFKICVFTFAKTRNLLRKVYIYMIIRLIYIIDNYTKLLNYDFSIKLFQKLSFVFLPTSYKQIRKIRILFETTDTNCIVSFLGKTNIKTLISGFDLNKKIIISERNDPSRQILKFPWENLRRRFYKKANYVTANSQGAIETMSGYVPKEKLVFIPNPAPPINFQNKNINREKIIISTSRLVEQKNLPLLLNAFSIIHKKIPDWKVLLIGDGPLKYDLIDLVIKNHIRDKVEFLGYQKNVFEFLEIASIFSLTSNFEGTPNALLEAMSFGLPAVISDASPGPKELIRDGYNGYVFKSGDIHDLSDKLYHLAISCDLRNEMGNNHKKFLDRYKLKKIALEWESLF